MGAAPSISVFGIDKEGDLPDKARRWIQSDLTSRLCVHTVSCMDERIETNCVPKLGVVVFMTGAAGLIYQVTWHRYLGRLLGSDSIATAVILASFLGGLSLGYILCGIWSARVKYALRAYAVLEGIIGMWCLLFPLLFALIESVTHTWRFQAPLLMILQGGICSGLLMGVPTVCMGGTLPLLTRGLSLNTTEATRIHARVYAVNTLGAFVGTLLGGFALIPLLGLKTTMRASAMINLGAFLYLYYTARTHVVPMDSQGDPQKGAKGSAPTATSPPCFPAPVLYGIALLSGCYVMMLENVFIRMINLTLGSSAYSFSMIVAVFILCIAVGSYIVSRLKSISNAALWVNQLVIVLLLLGVYLTLDTWPYWAHRVRILCPSPGMGICLYYTLMFCCLLGVLSIPLCAIGATVPLVFHELRRGLRTVGKTSGILLAWNTLGNLGGSLIGGILLYMVLDIPGIYLGAVGLAALSVCLAGRYLSRPKFVLSVSMPLAVGLVAFCPSLYQKSRFMTGTFRERVRLPYSHAGPRRFFREFNRGRELLFYEDGPTATVAVTEGIRMPTLNRRPRAIWINGKSDSSTLADISTLRLLTHLPALLAESRARVMVIGLGTGVTAGELTLYPDVQRIDIAEISPLVIKTLPYFQDFTHRLEQDPRVRIHRGDAFRIMVRSTQQWDIVISEPTNPWTSGVDQLFTREFYQRTKERLTPDGMLVQWAHRYAASTRTLGMILNTVQAEFSQVRVFMGSYSDVLIIASDTPITLEGLVRAEQTLQGNASVKASLQDINITCLDALLLRELWTPSAVKTLFAAFGRQTLDVPVLHYQAGLDFFRGQFVPDTTLLNSESAVYASEYLLRRKYPDWAEFPPSRTVYDALMTSTTDKGERVVLPMARPLRLKAYLKDPQLYPISGQEKETLNAPLFHLLSCPTPTAADWARAGLQDRAYRRRASVLIHQMSESMNWIACYPLDGLKRLLQEGMTRGADAFEKNWCALQYMLVLLLEQVDEAQINQVSNRLIRDQGQEILLAEEDHGLLLLVDQLMSSRRKASAQ